MAEPHLLREILRSMAKEYGVMYLRFPGKGKVCYYEEEQDFTTGKGVIVRNGVDATVIASGIEVAEAARNVFKEKKKESER